MGLSILELVLRRLRQANFTADVAYPGQKYPQITEPVAAVHIQKVDRANLSVTVEVNILCPASMGGTACEVEALRATETLRWSGAVCIQNGCSYDGVSQMYVVSVLATFTCITEEERCTMGPGFKVYIDEEYQPYVQAFSEEESHDRSTLYEMGEPDPKGICPGKQGWTISMEELIPAGSPETAEPPDAFEVQVVSDVKTEYYFHCRWTSIRREYTREGLKRIRKGICMQRVEERYGETGV